DGLVPQGTSLLCIKACHFQESRRGRVIAEAVVIIADIVQNHAQPFTVAGSLEVASCCLVTSKRLCHSPLARERVSQIGQRVCMNTPITGSARHITGALKLKNAFFDIPLPEERRSHLLVCVCRQGASTRPQKRQSSLEIGYRTCISTANSERH